MFGGGAVLLRRPHPCNRTYYSETVNDIDGFLVNAWRSIQLHPEATAEAASWPVAEADLHARHLALLRWRRERDLEKLMGRSSWCDPQMAGWWLWGCCSWIGSGWCSGDGPWVVGADGRITKRDRKDTPGVSRQLPHLSDNGMGVNMPQAREPGVAPGTPEQPWEAEDFHPLVMPELLRWFAFLSARLRHVRILNGDWKRAVTTGATHSLVVRQGKGPCGIFLDPPYSLAERANGLYTHDTEGLAEACRIWCLKNGDNPRYHIVLAGFAGEGHEELEQHGWRAVEWFQAGHLKGGMCNLGDKGEDGEAAHQQDRERLWLSPHCCQPVVERTLFDGLETL